MLNIGGYLIMLYKNFLEFNNFKNIIVTEKQLFPNIQGTFTIEFWAKPEATHEVDKVSRRGISKILNQRFAVTPVFGAYGDGDKSRVGIGISIGTNGVSVYEHTTNHLVATLVFETSINSWTHVAVVYINRTPFLYINGEIVKRGLSSYKKRVVPSGVFGGLSPYNFYVGGLQEMRIWKGARTQSEIKEYMNREITGDESEIFGYWKLNEGSGNVVYDSTVNKNHGTIKEAKWFGLENNQPSQINILFTFYIPSGGVETLNRQRFYALSQKGINCDFLYTQSGTGLQNKINTSIFVTNDENKIRDIISKKNYKAIIVATDLHLLKKIRNFGYKGLLIYEIQGLGFNKEHADDFLKNQAYSIINEYCDGLLYPQTPHLIQAFEKYYPSKKKFCFHNCFNTNDFSYEIHPKRDAPIIGWVGRLEENKNWRDFLLIGADLIKENPSINLWMFEDNTLSTQEERLAFEQKIKELNLDSHLTIYANQPHSQMARFLSIIGDSGGFLCSTSKVEGFGYAVLEAMVCKCPVLSTDSDGVRSFITHNLTGKFYDLGNISHAVKEGKELLSNKDLREEIRRKAVEHINKNFSPAEYADNFLNMILSFTR